MASWQKFVDSRRLSLSNKAYLIAEKISKESTKTKKFIIFIAFIDYLLCADYTSRAQLKN